jgi:hypothetical protein
MLEYVNILYQIDMRSENKRQDLGLPLAIFTQAFLRTSKKNKRMLSEGSSGLCL